MRVGVIGRFKPFHWGAAAMLDSICEKAEEVVIGIGSSNRYDMRNPFTPAETEGMINAYLAGKFSNYSFVHIPDFGHLPEFSDGQRWRQEILKKFGILDLFISGNAWVRELMQGDYTVTHPVPLIHVERRTPVSGTRTRVAMAYNLDLDFYLPDEVQAYMVERSLLQRFREEFGYDIIMRDLQGSYHSPESAVEEKCEVTGG